MARLFRPVTRMISSSPEATASSTTYWMVGLSTSGSISLGWALVTGRKRVPRPAAGNTPLRTFIRLRSLLGGPRGRPLLALEGLPDPATQVVLGVQPPLRLDLGGQPEDRLGAVEPDDTVRLRGFQRDTALARPLLARPLQHVQRRLHRHLPGQRDLDHRAGPAAAAVGERR